MKQGKCDSNTKRMRRPRGVWLLLAILLTLPLCACGGNRGSAGQTEPEPVSLDLSNTGLNDISDLLSRTDLTALDLRGDPISVEQYDTLFAALPNCDILWSVPVGNDRVDSDAVSAALTGDTAALETVLPYLPHLSEARFVNTAADGYAALIKFAADHPQIAVNWNVELAGSKYPQDTVSLDLSGAVVGADALSIALSGLPRVREVRLGESSVFTLREQLALSGTYPEISFIWNVPLLEDFSVSSDAAEIDLRGHTVPDAEAFSDALALLPELTYADMCGCGLSDEEMLALRGRYPAVKFVWLIRVAGWEIRTDIKGFSTGQRYRFPDGAGAFVGGKHSYQSYRSGDFENLTLCTDLVALDVGHCSKIGDVGFIARLPKLKYLVLTLCDISDISPLAGQTDLEFVEIKDNYITDLSPLADCAKIRFLNCANNEITDFSAVENMPDLERLWMSKNRFTAAQADELQAALPNTDIKASRTNASFADSLWRKGNEGYLEMQAIFGLRAQNQGVKAP